MSPSEIPSDPYRLLGVSPDAGPEAIREAYIKKIKDVHPDAGGSEELAKLVNQAYSFLKKRSARQTANPNPTADKRKKSKQGSSYEEEWMREVDELFRETVPDWSQNQTNTGRGHKANKDDAKRTYKNRYSNRTEGSSTDREKCKQASPDAVNKRANTLTFFYFLASSILVMMALAIRPSNEDPRIRQIDSLVEAKLAETPLNLDPRLRPWQKFCNDYEAICRQWSALAIGCEETRRLQAESIVKSSDFYYRKYCDELKQLESQVGINFSQ